PPTPLPTFQELSGLTFRIAPPPPGTFLAPGNVTLNESQVFNRPGFTFAQRDSFQTRNQFYGGEIGLRSEVRFFCRFFANVTAKVAVGFNRATVDISGVTEVVGGGTAVPVGAPVITSFLITSPVAGQTAIRAVSITAVDPANGQTGFQIAPLDTRILS